MKKFIEKEININGTEAYTENGGLAYGETGSACLDLFAHIGAMRNYYGDIIKMFSNAYAEDKLNAVKIMFYGRDIRAGVGERNTFRILINYFANFYPQIVGQKVFLDAIREYGRYDDYLACLNTSSENAVTAYLKSQLEKDIAANEKGESISLLAKWLPSINTSSDTMVALAKKLAKSFNMSPKTYRKTLSLLRKGRIIENYLRKKDYSFDYSKQPSQAMHKYRNAFFRNDSERYRLYIGNALNGKTKMNTATLFPYQIVKPILNDPKMTKEEKDALNAAWVNIDRTSVTSQTIVVMDGSGSMYSDSSPSPISVALSLAILFAEELKGEFKNTFISFSENPKLINLPEDSIFNKVMYAEKFDEAGNTNLEKVFKLILNAAIKNKVPAEQLPARIVIISDMEFDECIDNGKNVNLYASIEKLYQTNGYVLPETVFWNVEARNRQFPVTKNQQGVKLVSGFSKNIIGQIISGALDDSPYEFMVKTLKTYDRLNELKLDS